MSDQVSRLLHRLELEQGATSEASTTWHGEAGENALNMSNRLFGGMVVAQTIVAAGRTYADKDVHSLQQVFLRGGRSDVPLQYRVERLFTGRTYASVRVEVHQGDDIISHAQVGVTAGIESPDRQDPAPTATPFDQTVNRDEFQQRPDWETQPVEARIDPAIANNDQAVQNMWIRPVGSLPDDPLLHKAVLGYASDRGMMSLAWKPERPATFKGSTLNHSVWFHRALDFNEWHNYAMVSPTLSGGLGFMNGTIHHHDGTHVASTSQQGTFRPTQE